MFKKKKKKRKMMEKILMFSHNIFHGFLHWEMDGD